MKRLKIIKITLLLILFIFSINSFSQFSKTHYIPPIATTGQGAADALDQFKESTEAVVEMIQGLTVFVFAFIPFLIILIPIGYLIRLGVKKKNNSISVPKVKFGKVKKEPKE